MEKQLELRQMKSVGEIKVYEYIWSKVFPNEELNYDDFYDWSSENTNRALELALEYCDKEAVKQIIELNK